MDPAEKERRAHVMGEAVAKSRQAFLRTQVGRTEEVLIERLRHGYYEGYTKNYTPVHIPSGDGALCGEIRRVTLTEAREDWCEGVLENA